MVYSLEILPKTLEMMVEDFLDWVLIRDNQYIPSNRGWIIVQFYQDIRDLDRVDNVRPVCNVFAARGLADVSRQVRSL